MVEKKYAKFGGLDLAKRTDNSALIILTLKEGVLYHTGQKIWPHVDYKVQSEDLLEIQKIERMNIIGVDRTGVGDAVIELFPAWLQKSMVPIITTQPKKLEIIDTLQAMFQKDILRLHPNYSLELVEEILEQERTKSDAGNILYRHPTGSHDDRFWALGYAAITAAPYVSGIPAYICAVGDDSHRRPHKGPDMSF